MKFAVAALALAIAMFAVPADAVIVTSIRVTNLFGEPLQIAELQAFQGNINVAPLGVATATSQLLSFTGPEKVNDGLTDGQPYGDGIYISETSDTTAALTLTFSRRYDITRLQIFGREDCCQLRDAYNFEFFNNAVGSFAGTLDATGQGPANTQFANFALAVPEPATWAMLIGGFGLVGMAHRRRRAGYVLTA